MKCINCHKEINDGAKFCVHCGASQPTGGGGQQVPQQNPGKKPGKEKKAKKEKRGCGPLVITVLIVLLLLVLGVGGGLFYYQYTGGDVTEVFSFIDRDKDEDEDEDEKDKKEKDDEDDEEDKEDEEEDEEEGEEEGEEAEESETEERAEEALTTAAALEEPTAPVGMTTAAATTAAAMETTAAVPVSASVVYASSLNLSGMVKAAGQQATVVESSHLVQQDRTISNHGWMAFDGDAVSSWQIRNNHGIGEYVGVSFDRTYQVSAVTFRLGNHRTDTLYTQNNTPKTLTIELGGQTFQATFPQEKTEFALTFSAPVSAAGIKVTINDVYRGSKYDDTAIAEIGVYGN